VDLCPGTLGLKRGLSVVLAYYLDNQMLIDICIVCVFVLICVKTILKRNRYIIIVPKRSAYLILFTECQNSSTNFISFFNNLNVLFPNYLIKKSLKYS
jgi:hypothetical protein